MTLFNLEEYLSEMRGRVDTALDEWMTTICADTPKPLAEAMRYSLLGGGKRLRPILALATCEAAGGRISDAMDIACAVEMIHTYSLVHDDLPAIDNDDFRRGRPTCHKAFGEAMAILAGDALLTEAFRVAASGRRTPGRAARVGEALFELGRGAGASGMVGGQVLDLQATGREQKMTLAELDLMHRLKTGELIRAAVRAGARMGGATVDELPRFDGFATALGLAFQIIDDVLDVTGELETIGKSPGSDRAAGKTTFVDLMGIDAARGRAYELMEQGIAGLSPLGKRASILAAVGRYLVERDR